MPFNVFTDNLFCFLNLSATVKTTYCYCKLNDKKKFHSLSLWVSFCFANKFFCVMFLDSAYKRYHMVFVFLWLNSFQFSSTTQSCLTLCDPMDCNTPRFPVQHQLPELAQTHVHQVGDAIQPSHPLSPPSPPSFNLPQHQGLSQWVCSSH